MTHPAFKPNFDPHSDCCTENATCFTNVQQNKNLAIANRSRVSCAHNTLGALKMQDKTLQDRTMTDKLAWPDFAGQDNDGQEKHHA